MPEARGKDVFTAMMYSKPRRCKRTPTLHPNEREVTTFEENTAIFRKTLFPPPPEINMDQDEAPSRRKKFFKWKDTTNQEIITVINSQEVDNAPGPDGLNLKGIPEAYKAIPERLNNIYRVLTRAGYYPEIWREPTVVIIPKPASQTTQYQQHTAQSPSSTA